MRHSEANDSETEPLRFIQMWIVPRKTGLKPNYGSYQGRGAEERKDKWVHMVAPVESAGDAKAKVNQDVNIFVTELSEAEKKIDLPLMKGRQAYVLAVEGSVTVVAGDMATATLNQQDAAEVVSSGKDGLLSFTAQGGPAHILVVEMREA